MTRWKAAVWATLALPLAILCGLGLMLALVVGPTLLPEWALIGGSVVACLAIAWLVAYQCLRGPADDNIGGQRSGTTTGTNDDPRFFQDATWTKDEPKRTGRKGENP